MRIKHIISAHKIFTYRNFRIQEDPVTHSIWSMITFIINEIAYIHRHHRVFTKTSRSKAFGNIISRKLPRIGHYFVMKTHENNTGVGNGNKSLLVQVSRTTELKETSTSKECTSCILHCKLSFSRVAIPIVHQPDFGSKYLLYGKGRPMSSLFGLPCFSLW